MFAFSRFVTRTFPALCCTVLLAPAPARAEMPKLFADDFEHGMKHWQTSDPDQSKLSWEIIETEGPAKKLTHALRTNGTSKYEPPFRSPPNFVLLKDVEVGDFELTVKIQNTRPDAGPHRDLCIFWGYQGPAHYYYVHFGAISDPNACQIFIVNDAARTPITVKTAKGTPWRNDWHDVKVVRRTDDGAMDVFFDDMKSPFMTAKDKTFLHGRVGLGTFDDHGNFDDFELRGEKVETQKQ